MLLLLVLSSLEPLSVGSESELILFYHSAVQQLTFGFFASQIVVYLLYPLLGWVSDVYFTRYKVLRLAFIIFIAGSVLFILDNLSWTLENSDNKIGQQ